MAGKTTIVVTLKEGTKVAEAKKEVSFWAPITITCALQLHYCLPASLLVCGCDVRGLMDALGLHTGGGEEKEEEEAEETTQAWWRWRGWQRGAEDANLRVQEVHLRGKPGQGVCAVTDASMSSHELAEV